ncbi:hypothetical protein CAPTEDRAFT_196235 [Capitella teleta]|uniref:Uncharacterized protein n=1 Tax=Capitella teleta TaxID=283909 RepID=R7UB08_CAPTE|nr:hypothetical protein CAPTEDRAFT_196235 [Capitella teleta]|eukprot:ELU00973.1 hypothetical protein CAPTEDRAFT_196235 [Capitella teleta]
MDAVKAIKKMELEHETDLIRLQLEEARVITADRQHAREQHKDHWMPPALTMILALMVGLMCAETPSRGSEAMSKETIIKLDVEDQKLEFGVGVKDFNDYQNECMSGQTGMVDASHNFLVRTVSKETGTALQGFLKDYPGAAIDICGAVISKYRKPLKITVGK